MITPTATAALAATALVANGLVRVVLVIGAIDAAASSIEIGKQIQCGYREAKRQRELQLTPRLPYNPDPNIPRIQFI
jgi:hypothetical protein